LLESGPGSRLTRVEGPDTRQVYHLLYHPTFGIGACPSVPGNFHPYLVCVGYLKVDLNKSFGALLNGSRVAAADCEARFRS